MSKYDPLYRWLQQKAASKVQVDFSEIESVLGSDLPPSARKENAWWANEEGKSRHVQCRAWLNAGYRTQDINLTKESVNFVSESLRR